MSVYTARQLHEALTRYMSGASAKHAASMSGIGIDTMYRLIRRRGVQREFPSRQAVRWLDDNPDSTFQAAADRFGVTRQAVASMWYKLHRGEP